MAYDDDKLDKEIKENFDVNLVFPHRKNRVKTPSQDGRTLRRYKKRWSIKRFRRLRVKYDRSISSYETFLTLACIMILLKEL